MARCGNAAASPARRSKRLHLLNADEYGLSLSRAKQDVF
jgi:hypothetical protein